MTYDELKLDNQLCFPIYAASRLVTRAYQPLLDNLGISYPQYLVLLVLWERNGLPVTELGKKLMLNTNTLTPILQRMEKQGLLFKQKSETDSRKTIITLSWKAEQMKEEARKIPLQLTCHLKESNLNFDEMLQLKNSLESLIQALR
ncbi:MAG: MarR family winged helix-turn-helix transcriptional regulator [Mangrovibacterium sp.]